MKAALPVGLALSLSLGLSVGVPAEIALEEAKAAGLKTSREPA